MRNSIFFIFFQIVWVNSLYAQENQLINIGQVDRLYSEILEERRDLWIYVPQSAQSSPDAKYPVIYLLDGDAYFHALAGIVKQLSSFGNTACPESIIVAIPNTDRNRDLSPHDPANDTQPKGGIYKFTQFLEKELIPYVDKKYPVLQHRTLIGHSLGGSFVVNTLIEHPDLFTNYLAIDPGLKFHEYRFLDYALEKLKKDKYPEKSLFLTVANTMPANMDTLTAQKDSTWVTSTIRTNLKFAKTLSTFTSNQLSYHWKYCPQENHLNVPIISEYEGLKYFFSWHLLDLDQIIRTNPDLSGTAFYQKIVAHYQTVSKKLAHQVLPNEGQVYDLGEYFMNQGDFIGAQKFFQLNIQNFPDNSDHVAVMGDLYAEQQNHQKAREYYQKAFQMDGNTYAKRRLEEIKTED